jgi:hypothetical protein
MPLSKASGPIIVRALILVLGGAAACSRAPDSGPPERATGGSARARDGAAEWTPRPGMPADFSASTLLGSKSRVTEGEAIDFLVVVRNSGGQPPQALEVVAPVPAAALLAAHDSEFRFDAAGRELRWRGTVGPGHTRRLGFRLLAIPGFAGTVLTESVAVQAIPGGTMLHFSTAVEAEPARTFPLFGALRITWTGLIVLGFLIATPLAALAALGVIRTIERRHRQASPEPAAGIRREHVLVAAGGLMLGLAFLAAFAPAARSDLRIWTAYRAADCTVLDRAVVRPPGAKRWRPLLAVRYQDDQAQRFAVGFDASSRLRSGARATETRRLLPYRIGQVYPCWYDPAQPRRIVVERRPGGLYLFALLPLLVLILPAVYGLRWLARRAAQPAAAGGPAGGAGSGPA